MNQNKKKISINIVTILRIVGIPLIFYLEDQALFIFVNLLFITDFLDGYLARKYNIVTKLGGVLDLIADKLLVTFLLIFAYLNDQLSLLIITLIILREIISMILRYSYNKKEGEIINPSIYGKSKTALQFMAFDLMILGVAFYTQVFWLVIIISYYSLFRYFKEVFKREG